MRCKGVLSVEAVLSAAKSLIQEKTLETWDFPELAFYRSRFLSNGALVYIPIPSSIISGHYLRGYLHRLMWEAIMDIPSDKEYIHEVSSRAGKTQIWQEIHSETRLQWNTLSEDFSWGQKITQELLAAFSGAGDMEMVKSKHHQLQHLSKRLGQLGEGDDLLADFFRFEMMDSEYAPYPKLAEILQHKYAKLLSYTEKGIRVLDSLSQT
jgi:hypothetical protein